MRSNSAGELSALHVAMLLKADLLQHLALQMLVMVLYQALCGACVGEHRDQR